MLSLLRWCDVADMSHAGGSKCSHTDWGNRRGFSFKGMTSWRSTLPEASVCRQWSSQPVIWSTVLSRRASRR